MFIRFKETYIILFLALICNGICNGQELVERVYSPGGPNPVESIYPGSDGGAWLLMGRAGVLKLDENLDVDWYEIYSLLGFDHLVTLAETDEGGIIAGGYEGTINVIYNPTPLLTRISPSGEVIWARSFELSYLAYVQTIIQLESGLYVAVFNSDGGQSSFVYFDEDGVSFSILEPRINGSGVQTFDCINLGEERFLVGGDFYDEGLDQTIFYLAEFEGQIPIWAKTYGFQGETIPFSGLYITTTANGDIGLSSRITESDSQVPEDIVLFRTDEIGALKWAKKMDPNNESISGLSTGLLSYGENGICHSLAYLYDDDEMVSHFSGWNLEGENLFSETVTKTNLEQRFYYEYRNDEGLFVLSSEFREFATDEITPVLALQGPQGEMPCDQSSESIIIEDVIPEVTDVTMTTTATSVESTGLETSKVSLNVASYILCSSGLSTSNPAAEPLIRIYPNPSDNKIFFDLSQIQSESTIIQIFDELGREVFVQTGIRESLFSVSKESIGSGFFIARISDSNTGEVLQQRKIVVK